jgi:hypothetical protein
MRLIDADALENQFGVSDEDLLALDEIRHAPTVDAVPVVRCKDCKYYYECGVNFCDRLGMDCPGDSDFFCSYGERKDGAENG